MVARVRLLSSDEYKHWFWRVYWGEVMHEGGVQHSSGAPLTAGQFRGLRLVALIALLGEVGLRVGEAVRLRWGSVETERGRVPVVSVPADVAKGRRPRVVVLTPAAAWALSEWGLRVAARWAAGTGDLVLRVSESGRGYTTRGAQAAVNRLARKYGGFVATPHTLRRTFGDRCRRLGDVRLAQIMLGHSQLASTERYLGGSLDEQAQLALRLSAELFPAGPPGLSLKRWAPAGARRDGNPAGRQGSPGTRSDSLVS